jgi:hypothetical protein
MNLNSLLGFPYKPRLFTKLTFFRLKLMHIHLKNVVSSNFLIVKSFIAISLISYSLAAFALDNTDKNGTQVSKLKQSFLSCSLITSEHLTALQLYQRGLPKELALASLPGISRDGKKRLEYVYDWAKRIGILNAYADINTNYARCSTLVYEQNGKPAADLKEHAYYFCSGENKIRYEIILKLDKQMSMQEVTHNLPARYLQVAESYQQLITDKGLLAAFDLTANNLKACLQQIE